MLERMKGGAVRLERSPLKEAMDYLQKMPILAVPPVLVCHVRLKGEMERGGDSPSETKSSLEGLAGSLSWLL